METSADGKPLETRVKNSLVGGEDESINGLAHALSARDFATTDDSTDHPLSISTATSLEPPIMATVDVILARNKIETPQDVFRILHAVYKVIYEIHAADVFSVPEVVASVACHISQPILTVYNWMMSEDGYLLQLCKDSRATAKVKKMPVLKNLDKKRPMEFMHQICILRGSFNGLPTPTDSVAQELVLATQLPKHSVLAWHSAQSEVYNRRKKDKDAQEVSNIAEVKKRKLPTVYTTPVRSRTDVRDATHDTNSSVLDSQTRTGRQLMTPSTSSVRKRGAPRNDSEPAAKRPKVFEMFCPSCEKGYPTTSAWRDHQKRNHFPQKTWRCWLKSNNCRTSKVYFRSDVFRNHLKDVHQMEAHAEVEKQILEHGKPTSNLFHNRCGFPNCSKEFRNSEESLNHIADKIKMGATREQWTDRCTNNHEEWRRFHLSEQNKSSRDDDDGGNGDGNSNVPPEDQGGSHHDLLDGGFFSHGDNSWYPGYHWDSDFFGSNNYGYQQQSQEHRKSTFNEDHLKNLKTFGNDEVISGTKTVKLWKDNSTSKICVQKSISRNQILIEDDEATADFRNWLSRSKSLDHKHITKVHDAFLDDDHFVVISSPVAKTNLAECFASNRIEFQAGTRDIREQILSWMICLKSGLAYLHRSCATHHDIKPSNILLLDDSRILITDFVNAKHLLSGEGSTHEAVLEQSHYHAPEVDSLDKRSQEGDIFSLGCVFAELLTLAFGESIEAFEDHRGKKHHSVAFAETSDAARTWVELLHAKCPVEVQSDRNLQAGFDTVLLMLAEKPEERPKADELNLPFHSLCDCSNHGNTTESPHRAMNVMASSVIARSPFPDLQSRRTVNTNNFRHEYQPQQFVSSNPMLTVNSDLFSANNLQPTLLSYSRPIQPHLHPPSQIDNEHVIGVKSVVSGSPSPAAMMKSFDSFLASPIDLTRYGGVLPQAANVFVLSPSLDTSVDWSDIDFLGQNGLYDESPSAVPSLIYSTPDNGSVHPMTPGDRINLGSHTSKKNKLFSSSTAAIASNVSPPSIFYEPDDMEAGGLLDDGLLLD